MEIMLYTYESKGLLEDPHLAKKPNKILYLWEGAAAFHEIVQAEDAR